MLSQRLTVSPQFITYSRPAVIFADSMEFENRANAERPLRGILRLKEINMGLLKGDVPTSASTTPTASGGFNAILDRGSEFEGKLTFEGTVRIDGRFKGEIKSDAMLVVGESGKVDADIQVGSISVSGEVKGNITAKNKIELHAPAVVQGNLQTASLVIEDGVTFEGSCIMEKTGHKTATPQPIKKETSSPSSNSSENKRGGDAHA